MPVRGARAWTTALVPNARGGWNFITQTYEAGSTDPTEFVVLDLTSGKQTVSEGPPGLYANSNYQVGEQLRARNGRVFFPEVDNQIAYYDPRDETVKQVGKLAGTPADKLVFRVVFGSDGRLYGGTQSAALPTVFELDPDTLRYRVIGTVGRNRTSYSYAYYLAADPPWLYVAVGESPWELAAIHLVTGEQRILATRADSGFMQLETRPEGVTAKLISGLRTAQQVTDVVWCVDGSLVPFDPLGKPPFAPRDVAPRDRPIRQAPELDTSDATPDTDGIGRVRWRASAASRWNEVTFKVRHTSPIDIEALTPLPDGGLLGSASQYHGFFRYDLDDRSVRRYRPLGISGGPRAVIDGVVYFAGYPNGVLYRYDPRQPWTANREPNTGANPHYLGNFADAGAHYAYFLEPSVSGRLYYVGRRERDGVGTGIGVYDPATGRFAGHHRDLGTLDPRGFLVLDSVPALVLSGRTSGATAAQLIVFDRELHEQGRQTVSTVQHDTGQLFLAPDPHLVLGVSSSEHVIYRHDVAAGATLAVKPLPGVVDASAQRPSDRSLWLVIGAALWRFDPVSLEGRRVRDVPGPPAGPGLLTWQRERLFWAVAGTLRELVLPPQDRAALPGPPGRAAH